ncbi:MAG: patatin-like phospholipase family protein [Syntrophobacterales bacterium]|nr:patatin-like phospholipase family protein [Syntrophobacterales bacterium]
MPDRFRGRYLRIFAGSHLMEMIRDGGFKLENVRVIVGAAGGPKGLVLYHFDRYIADLISQGKIGGNELFLIGSSIGAWRMAALSCGDPASAVYEFFDAYMNQHYSLKPSVREISAEAIKILDAFFYGDRLKEALEHPKCRLGIITVRHRRIGLSDERYSLKIAMALIGLGNLISRKTIGHFLYRVVFVDPRNKFPLDFSKDFISTELVPLSEKNIRKALLASGAIPLVMESMRDIEGAPPGTYRDGGLIDYHPDLPYELDGDSFVLYPHYTDRIIPGWFDKYNHRRPYPERLEKLLLICPTKALVESLPGGKIPDRNDFYTFRGRDAERISCWKRAVDAGRYMVEEFLEVIEGGKLKDWVEPLEF